ncbi:MAG: hypothetical protein FVQ82_12945 [Planctomycetes bacterium]|nr:hypothetical protein [Planctomycetota bacterium]
MDFSIEDINVSDDHILLSDIVLENDITPKQLAGATGLAVSTIYKYLAGGCTIPSIVWRVVYKMTADARIVQLVTGDVPQVIVPLTNGTGIKANGDKLAGLIAMRQEQIEFESELLKVIASDNSKAEKLQAIETLKQKFPKLVTSQTQLLQAITGKYDFESVAN